MKIRGSIVNMTKGEVSSDVESRFDLSVYQAGLRKARNVQVRRTGGVAKRMGSRIVAEALGDTVRLIPFQFSDTNAYAMEFGQAYMRPLALGGAVLESGLSVTNITRANPATVTVQNHGYTAGEQVYFVGIEGMVEINGRFITILTVLNDDTFTIDINTTGFGAFTGSGGGQVNADPPAPAPPPPVVPPEEPTPVAPVIGSEGGGGYTDNSPGGPGWDGFPLPHIP